MKYEWRGSISNKREKEEGWNMRGESLHLYNRGGQEGWNIEKRVYI